MTSERKLSFTIKGTGGFDHPWLAFKEDTVEDLHHLISQAHEQDLFTAAGRAHAAFLRGAAMGAELGATTVKVEETPAKGQAPATPAAEEPAEPVVAPPIPEGAPKPAWKRS